MSVQCEGFKPFSYDPTICDLCGEPAKSSAHPRASEPDGLTAALWKVLIAEGGTWSYYGGGFIKAESVKDSYIRGLVYRNDMARINFHLATCEIDWKQTERPSMDGELSEFAGTECESARITGKLSGRLYCKCGEVGRYPLSDPIGIDDLTLGQLIWRVTRADDAE